VGSTPHADPAQAVDFVLEFFPDVPFWPQLPQRSFRENMYVQFAEHLPGIQIDDAEQRIHVALGGEWLEQAERFYERFLGEDAGRFAPSPEHAAGLYEMLREGPLGDAWAVKGQVTGPISTGLHITDAERRPALYDDMMRDVIVKNVVRHAQWQEAQLKALCPRTILSIDEPYLALVGSAYASLSKAGVSEALEEVFTGLQGLTCTHCCANTDWSILLETSVDILSFDAYGYAEHLALYPEALRGFLARGGMLAWGVIPNTGEAAETVTLDGAWKVLDRGLRLFERRGFERRALLARSFITPACGTGPRELAVGERVMRLARELSDAVRGEYALG
jgi:hypothetical protein